MCSCGSGRLFISSMALILASVPSSCGMFNYRLDTSVVTSRVSSGT